MKKIVLSLALLCSVPAYTMEQKDFLSERQVASLARLLKENANDAEMLRQDQCLANCADKAHRLLLQQHTDASIGNPKKLLKQVQEQVSEECVIMDDLQAMYKGMIWAGRIKKTVMESENVKTLMQEVRENPLDNNKAIELLLQYSQAAIETLEAGDPQKIYLKANSTLEKTAYYRSMLVPSDKNEQVNATIKKLFAYQVSMALACQVMNESASAASTVSDDESVTPEFSEEE